MKSCENCRNYSALDKDKYEYDFENACCGGDEKHEVCEYYEAAKEIVNTEEEIEKIYNNRYEAEAMDVQSVKHGLWYDVGYRYIDELGINLIHAYCNRCHRITFDRSYYGHTMDCKYCSRCGAIMDNWGMKKI